MADNNKDKKAPQPQQRKQQKCGRCGTVLVAKFVDQSNLPSGLRPLKDGFIGYEPHTCVRVGRILPPKAEPKAEE